MQKEINIKDYSYDLPIEKIALKPLENRESSKLLVFENNKIQDSEFCKLKHYLPSGSTLVFNNTKVIQARLEIKKEGNGIIEVFLLESVSEQEMQLAMTKKGSARWKCLIGKARKFKAEKMHIETPYGDLTVSKPVPVKDSFEVDLEWPSEKTFAEMIESVGKVPLPPYLKREAEISDKLTYQTVYAEKEGSVAAPTAGLHFTPRLLDELAGFGIDPVYVQLHVGAGTFKPVKSENLGEHEMHTEEMRVSDETLKKLLSAKHITAVGTTSLRTLETLYWVGVKLKTGLDLSNNQVLVSQWEPYELELNEELHYAEAIEVILSYLKNKGLNELKGKTQLLIAPGYKIKSTQALLTNFHQPDSTLLLLVAAFVGDRWRSIYNHALNNNYRFLSYGDASLLIRSD